MKKKILNGVLGIFFIIVLYLLFQIGKNYSFLTLFCSFLAIVSLFFGLYVVYQRYIKSYPFSKRQILFYYGLYTIFFVLCFVIFQKEPFQWHSLLTFFLELGASYFLTLFVAREFDKSNWVFSFFFLALLPLFQMGEFHYLFSLSFFLSSFSLYLTTLFDNVAIYRKKNILLTFEMGLLMGILSYIYPISAFYLVFLFFILSRKRGIKRAMKLFPFMLLGYGLVASYQFYCGQHFFELHISHPLLFSSFFSAFFLFCFLVGTVVCFFKKERKMGYLCRGLLIILFAIQCFQHDSMFFVLGTFLPLTFFLFLSLFDNIPLFYKPIISTYKGRVKPQSIQKEKVSVVIPNYNYENYIVERIDSVLRQSYQIYELIILDDVSTDHSVEVIHEKMKEIKKSNPDLKVQFLPNSKNSGNVFKQWAKCFEVATGDFLWICEADDSASPHFLKHVMKAFEHEEVLLSYSESLTVDENDHLLMPNLREWTDIYYTGKWSQSYISTGKKELESTMCINNTISNVSAAVFRLRKDIPFLEYLHGAQHFHLAGDWYFYAKVLGHGSIAYYNKSLNYHRMHSKSVTLTTNGDLNYQEVCEIQDMISKEYKLPLSSQKRIQGYRAVLRSRFGLSQEELSLMNVSFDEVLKKSKVKDEILLSIIIPVYNTEHYLKKCLDSVLKKFPPKTEIIIVNDGSPDHSEKIILEYEKQYKGIVFGYKKENGGLSSAKNYGLQKAHGRYVIFLDSDDFVAPNMYATLLKKGLLENADLVCCDIYEYYEDGEKIYRKMVSKEREDTVFGLIDTPLMATSCNKICKRSLFQGLTFPEGLVNEDIAVTPVLYGIAKRIFYIDSPFYYYLQRTGSIQNSGFNEKRFSIFKTAKCCFETLETLHASYIPEIKGSIYTHQILGILLFLIPKVPRKERLHYIKLFIDNIMEFDDFETNPYVLEYVKKYHLPKLIGYIMNKSIYKLDLYLQIKMR